MILLLTSESFLLRVARLFGERNKRVCIVDEGAGDDSVVGIPTHGFGFYDSELSEYLEVVRDGRLFGAGQFDKVAGAELLVGEEMKDFAAKGICKH